MATDDAQAIAAAIALLRSKNIVIGEADSATIVLPEAVAADQDATNTQTIDETADSDDDDQNEQENATDKDDVATTIPFASIVSNAQNRANASENQENLEIKFDETQQIELDALKAQQLQELEDLAIKQRVAKADFHRNGKFGREDTPSPHMSDMNDNSRMTGISRKSDDHYSAGSPKTKRRRLLKSSRVGFQDELENNNNNNNNIREISDLNDDATDADIEIERLRKELQHSEEIRKLQAQLARARGFDENGEIDNSDNKRQSAINNKIAISKALSCVKFELTFTGEGDTPIKDALNFRNSIKNWKEDGQIVDGWDEGLALINLKKSLQGKARIAWDNTMDKSYITSINGFISWLDIKFKIHTLRRTLYNELKAYKVPDMVELDEIVSKT